MRSLPAVLAGLCSLTTGKQVICAGARVASSFEESDVSDQAGHALSVSGEGSLFAISRDLKLKSLILAQIERWRHA